MQFHRHLLPTLTASVLFVALSNGTVMANDIVPVSVAVDPIPTGVRSPSISEDGRYLVYESKAATLVSSQVDPTETGSLDFDCIPGGFMRPYLCTTDGDYDVFLFDRETGETSLISHEPGDVLRARSLTSQTRSISRDGSHIVYTRYDPAFPLREELTLYERATQTTSTVVTTGITGFPPFDNDTVEARIADDGSVVVWAGFAPGFSDSNGGRDLFLFDRDAGTIDLVSRTAGSPTTTRDLPTPSVVGAMRPSAPRSFDISGDGDRVVFVSRASDLVTGDANGIGRDVFLFDHGTGAVSPASRRVGGGTGDRLSEGASISRDGTRIAFQSRASNLITGFIEGAGASASDIFLYQPDTDTMTLVSHADGIPLRGGNGTSFDATISRDGAHVVFLSTATNLVPGFVNGNGDEADVYRYDVATGVITLVSRSVNGMTMGADGAHKRPRIDDAGTRVFFESLATDLVASFIDGNDALTYDLFAAPAAGPIALVNRADGTTATSSNSGADSGLVSGDGSVFVYHSDATNLTSLFGSGTREIFTYTPDDDVNRLVTSGSRLAQAETTAEDFSTLPTFINSVRPRAISDDGRFVAFESEADNLIAGQTESTTFEGAFLFDRDTGTNTLVSRAFDDPTEMVRAVNPQVSGNGEIVVFESQQFDLVDGFQVNNGAGLDLYIFDRASGTNSLLSRSTNGPSEGGNGDSRASSLSGDGRFVAFRSTATDLVAGAVDANGTSDLFLFDRQDQSLSLLSSNATSAVTAVDQGASGTIAHDGRHALIRSTSTDFIAGFSSPGGATISNLYLLDRISDERFLVSRDATNAALGADAAAVPRGLGRSVGISDDGQSVLFTSNAQNLVAGFVDANVDGADLYLWDRATGLVSLVSRSTAGPTTGIDGGIFLAEMSGDGDWVAFSTAATDVIAGFVDGNAADELDVYLLEVATGQVSLVSQSTTGPTAGGDGPSQLGALYRRGGQLVVDFESESGDLFSGFAGPNEVRNVYRYDVQTGSTELLSREREAPNAGADSAVSFGGVSRDGTVIAAWTAASNLVPFDRNRGFDVFLVGDDLDADLTLTKSDLADPVPSGGTFVYRFEIENEGPSSATAVRLFDLLPDGVEVLGAAGTDWRCFGNRNDFGCFLRRGLAAGEIAPPIDLEVRAPLAAGAIVNTASVMAAPPDAAPGSNEDDETTIVSADVIFADGFESSDTSAWSSTVP